MAPRRTESRWTRPARSSSRASLGTRSCGMRRPGRHGPPSSRSSARTGTEIQSQKQNTKRNKANSVPPHPPTSFFYKLYLYLYLRSIAPLSPVRFPDMFQVYRFIYTLYRQLVSATYFSNVKLLYQLCFDFLFSSLKLKHTLVFCLF